MNNIIIVDRLRNILSAKLCFLEDGILVLVELIGEIYHNLLALDIVD